MSVPANPAGGNRGERTLRSFLDPRREHAVPSSTLKERLKAITPDIVRVAKELGFIPDRATEAEIKIAKEKKIPFEEGTPDTTFDIVPTDVIDTIAAYHMPGTYNHWSRGEDWWRARQERARGSRIYELVLNTRPEVKAYLADNNEEYAQRVTIAHVLGHTDFFAHNVAFKNTDPYMVQKAAEHARRIDEYEQKYGIDVVEEFIDAANAIWTNIEPNPNEPINRLSPQEYIAWGRKQFLENWARKGRRSTTEYDDMFELEDRGKEQPKPPTNIPFPATEERDFMRFVNMFAPEGLEDWQADTLDIVRSMMVHSRPQGETQIMNEGWASYAHTTILKKMHEDGLIPDESNNPIGESVMLAGVMNPNRYRPNPYQLGLAIWEDIARKYRGEPLIGDKGETIVERDYMGNVIDYTKLTPQQREQYNPRYVMETHRDESFLREFLTVDLVKKLNLYQYALREDWGEENWTITTRDAQTIIDGLVESKVNMEQPVIVVPPGGGDYEGRKELYLLHKHEKKEHSDLDIEDTHGTLMYMYTLWGRPVHLETYITEDAEIGAAEDFMFGPRPTQKRRNHVVYTCVDGQNVSRKILDYEVLPNTPVEEA